MSNQLVKQAPSKKWMYVSNAMFLPALLLLTTSVLLYGNWKLGTGLILLISIRIFRLQTNWIWIIVLLVLLGYLGTVSYSSQQFQTQKQLVGKYENNLTVYPDEYQVKGNLLIGKAVVGDKVQQQTVTMLATILKPEEQKWLLAQTGPVQLTVEGIIEPIKQPTNFNQFDPQLFYKIQNISNQLVASRITNFKTVSHLGWQDKIHKLRSQFNHYCQQLPANLKIYALGLISGYRESDFYELTPGVTQLGLLHLFSISGMHVAYLLMILDGSCRWLPEKLRLILEAIILVIYFIFAGATVGLLRAVLSAEIKIICRLFKFHISPLDVWSSTLIINLFLFPAAIFLLACQFSYALSFGLIILQNRGTISKTIWLNLLSLPIILENIFEWHALSLLVNILILPIFSWFIIPLVLLGVGLDLIQLPGVMVINFIIGEFNNGLNVISRLPGMITFGKPGLINSLILFSLTVAIIIKKRTKFKIVLLIAFYGICFIRIHYPTTGEVTMFDVGQGDSFLVRTPHNRSVNIIDTGGKLTFNTEKWQQRKPSYQAERTAINYLKSIGIQTVDNVWLSHQDADHCGDLPAYLQKLHVNNLIVPAGMETNPKFLQRLKRGHFTNLIPVTDQVTNRLEPFECFHPSVSGEGKNEDSLVLGGTFGRQKWLFTGDLDGENELKLLNKYPQLKANVLKVGHHGSKTASNPQFIKQLNPKVAWISAGRNNRYNHPNQETLTTLDNNNIKVMNTQQDGMIQYSYRNNQAGTIKRDAKQRRDATHGLLNF